MKSKIVHLVGTRPQYVKLFPLFKCLEERGVFNQLVYDTGQHFDANMSASLLEEFGLTDIRTGDLRNLAGAAQAGRMLENIWKFVEAERPDYAVIYGDTNSTAMAAVACGRLQIPFGHVEAGVRTLPEVGVQEGINRKIADHLAAHLFCVGGIDAENLEREGVGADRIHVVGDLMHDAFSRVSLRSVNGAETAPTTKARPDVLVTLHRSENIDPPERRQRLLSAFEGAASDYNFILPIHPRLRSLVGPHELESLKSAGVRVIEPLTYSAVVRTLSGAVAVITDSGGLPKDAAFAGVPSLVLRPDPIWNELWKMGYIQTVRDVDSFDESALRIFLASGSTRLAPYHQEPAAPQIAAVLESLI